MFSVITEPFNNYSIYLFISGETSAGKSSFLNLLLGSEFLPTYTCSCTSFITTLRYGPQKEARIIYGGPKSKVDVIKNLDKDGMERLYEITFMKEKEREEGHNVKEVQVYLPLELLKVKKSLPS
jgi:GTPase SAR1 family protein